MEERVVALLRDGVSVASVAREVGCAVGTVRRIGRKHGLVSESKPRIGEPASVVVPRVYDELFAERGRPPTLAEIGKRVGITRERVRQLLGGRITYGTWKRQQAEGAP